MEILRGIESMVNAGVNRVQLEARTVVSGDRYRFRQDGFDLDLTYITPRLIAMGFPGSTKTEILYRNDINDVATMLWRYHDTNFRVFNCSEKDYDYPRFRDHYEYHGWNDHHAPPLERLLQVVLAIDNYLKEDEKRVAIVHCMAGKSRTGTVITSYILYSRLLAEGNSDYNYDAQQAIDFYNSKRGVTPALVLPSQFRTFASLMRNPGPDLGALLSHELIVNPPPKLIHRIVLHPIPQLSFDLDNTGWQPHIEILDANGLLYSDAKPIRIFEEHRFITSSHHVYSAEFSDPLPVLMGDILIRFGRKSRTHRLLGSGVQYLFKIVFHTSFIPTESFLDFTTSDIDATSADLALLAVSSSFSPAFKCRIMFASHQ